jgi:hypothetical protein
VVIPRRQRKSVLGMCLWLKKYWNQYEKWKTWIRRSIRSLSMASLWFCWPR